MSEARYIPGEDCDCEGLCRHCELFGCADCLAVTRGNPERETEAQRDA